MDGPNAPRLRVRRKLQVHPRIVNRADDIRTPLVNRPFHRPFDTQEIENLLEDLTDAHDAEVRSLEAIVAVAADFRAWTRLQEFRTDAVRIEDARLLAS